MNSHSVSVNIAGSATVFSTGGLNPAQREAVLYLDGPCLVLAGAGSGKTRVISQKIVYLLTECGYASKHIAALTFTNKAAKEMAERVKRAVPAGASGLPAVDTRQLTVSTFHALGVRMMREEAAHVGLKTQFSILDADDALGIIQSLVASPDKATLKHIQGLISRWKNALIDPDTAVRQAIDEREQQAAYAYRSYAATLQAYQSIDFDDLIRLPAQIMQQHPQVCEKWQARLRYLLIDEYQDTNPCQYRLIQLLTGARAMFTAVGDDDQAIYAWRGATTANLAKLTQDYPQLKLIKLEQNYRSTQRILAAANQVIQHNPKLFDKKLWSTLGTGEAINVIPMDDDAHEAESVAMRISAHRFERRAHWKDYAILYRSNHQARVFEQALRTQKIPYVISGGQSYFDRAEIRDIMAYLRLIANDDDEPAFIRAVTTPKRGVGQATLEALGSYAAQRQVSLFAALFESGVETQMNTRQLEPLREFAQFIQRMQWRASRGSVEGLTPSRESGAILDDLVRAIAYEAYLYDTYEHRQAQSKWQNVLDLINWLKQKAEEDQLNLLQIVQHVALVTMLDKNEEESPDALRLSTLHAAKGLEFGHVFLVGCEEGLLPHQGRDDLTAEPVQGQAPVKPQDGAAAMGERIEEERRLMYVGITRAQRSLHITWCKARKRAKESRRCEPSRFIAEMGLDQYSQTTAPDPEAAPLSTKQRLSGLKGLLNQKKSVLPT